MVKIFLGGTCAESTWREELIEKLDSSKLSWFNPVVDDWTPECMENEIRERNICDLVLYTITPRMKGVYSIAEVVDDSNKQPSKTILCILKEDVDDDGNKISFDKAQLKSMNQVARMVLSNGGRTFFNLDELADYLNNY